MNQGIYEELITQLISSKLNDLEKEEYYIKEIKIDKAIWNPDGAYLNVKAGDWPIGVPSTFDKYLPK